MSTFMASIPSIDGDDSVRVTLFYSSNGDAIWRVWFHRFPSCVCVFFFPPCTRERCEKHDFQLIAPLKEEENTHECSNENPVSFSQIARVVVKILT